MTAAIACNEVLSFVLFVTCFYRALKTNSDTKLLVLVGFWLLTIASVVCFAAPLVSGWQPDVVSLTLLLAMTVIQSVTSYHWRTGPPKGMQREI